MLVFPNCKINIGLNVTDRRPDGYHNLQTLFYPVPIYDALEFTEASEASLQIVGLPIEGDPEKNLVMRAYRLMQQKHNLPNLTICLKKMIPMGAGLGGGSSDAAYMLTALNTHYALNISSDELETLAATLGADCPFFIKNRPRFAQGIGNEFNETSINLKGTYFILVKPNIHVSTAQAYANITPKSWDTPLAELLQMPMAHWKHHIKNDFEEGVFQLHPSLNEIKEQLYDLGATYASMSGSGSSLYGLFETQPEEHVLISLINSLPTAYVAHGQL